MKLELTKKAKKLEVYYDGKCGMCCSFIEWLEPQDRAMELSCLAYQSDEAKERFPKLVDYDPEKEIVVRVDEEEVYTGAEGWVWCMWSCKKYRKVARIMNSTVMLPLAKKVCYLVSKNRLKVSKLFFRKKAKQFAAEIDKNDSSKDSHDDCNNGNCKL